MSAALLLKRFIQRPLQVAYVVPSSPALIRQVLRKVDFSAPRVFVEFGPGEGCYSRELARRMHPESRLILFEIDPELSSHLEKQFAHDPRVEVIHGDAQDLPNALAARGLPHCDYIISGIPFSILDRDIKRALVQKAYDALAPSAASAFIIYQVTTELKGHARLFPRTETEYCIQNFPPMFVVRFYKHASRSPGARKRA
jgi:phospholipid N-methyltransferase